MYLTELIVVAFTIHTYVDEEAVEKHFDPQEITRNLQVIPFHSHSYHPYYNGYLQTGVIDNPHNSAWIYRSGGYYQSRYDETKEMFVLEDLLIQMKQALFTPEKINFLKELIDEYDAHCYLDIYTFNVGDYIENVSIPADIVMAIAGLNIDINVYTHSKPLSYYGAYRNNKLFEF